MNNQITHKHHYVWRKYLKPWGHTEGNKTFVWWNNKNVIKYTDLFDILMEKDFYQFKPLNELELFCLKEMFAKTKNVPVKKVNKSLDNLVEIIIKIDSMIDKKEEFSDYLIQAGENIQSIVEKTGLTPLDLLKKEELDLFNYNDNGIMIDFIIFVLFQYLRTKGIRDKAIKVLSNNDSKLKEFYKMEMNCNVDLSLDWDKVYNFGFLYIANQISYSMSAKQAHIRLMKTNKIKFIVSDQPVYNIADNSTKDFDLFYPITPELAIIISNKYKNNEIVTIANDEVNNFNYKTLKYAHNFIVGYDESYVRLNWNNL